MSIFKDKAIVLKIEKLKERELIYTLFTFEYGKIKAIKKWSKREKAIDLGNIINFEIVTNENSKIHKIKNIKIKSQFNTNKDKKFSEICKYLEILCFIYKEIPNGLSNKEIFGIIEEINNYEKINHSKLILSYIKIKSLLGILNSNNDNGQISKILKFIESSKINTILKLNGIDEELEIELNKI